MSQPQQVKTDVQPTLSRLEWTQGQLATLERQLGHAQRLATLGTLAAGVAHEINNILTPVLSYAHLARSRGDDPQFQARAFAKIISGVEAACEVVNAVLHYSTDREEPPVADVQAAVEASLDCLARDPAKDGITLVLQIGRDTSVKIRPLALQQALLNLILNACTALRGRSGTVTVEASQQPDETVRLVVRDDGPGISEDVLARVFEAFVSERRNGDGSSGNGLGLMVTRHLIESAGGSISVSSTRGRGAAFTITLPAAGVDEPAASQRSLT